MKKHIMVISMSTFRGKETDVKEFIELKNGFKDMCWHTNETSVKYVDHVLRGQAKLSKVFAFATKEVKQVAHIENYEGKSHLDIYKERINRGRKEPISVSYVSLEDDTELRTVYTSIGAMYDLIMNERKDTEDKIVVHIDLTGGLRHSSMLMLALIQMLKFSDIEIGNIIYTKYVANSKDGPCSVINASELMDMFTLIGGVEEFTTHGTVTQLERYYVKDKKKVPVPELQALLKQMNDLSNNITMGTNYQITYQAIGNLIKAINDFEKLKDKKDEQVFIEKLMPTVKSTYEPLIKSRDKIKNIMGIIKWCLDRQLYMQALTFYTEWTPNCLFEGATPVIKIVSTNLKNKIVESAKKKNSSFNVHFVRSYDIKDNKDRKKYFKMLIESKEIEIRPSAKEQTLQFIEEYNKYYSEWRNNTHHAKNKKGDKTKMDELKSGIEKSLDKLEQVLSIK